VWSWVYLSCVFGVVARPWRRAEKLVLSGSCVAPLRLEGLRRKQSTPSVWLGRTGKPSTVGEWDAARSAGCGTKRGMSSGASERLRYELYFW
jgi:hypothetical protein